MRPSPHVWANIEKRIGATSASGTRPTRAPPPRQTRTSTWRPLAVAAVVLVVLVGSFVTWRVTQPTLHPELTFIDKSTVPAWRVEADDDVRHLRLVALQGVAPQAGKSFELWALPDNGAAPVSLGLMPNSGRLDRDLTEAQRLALRGASKMAVSLEPEGGSRTGLPTGPVLYVGDRIKRA